MYPLEQNPNRHFYTTRNLPILGVVLHVTAGLQDLGMSGADHSAESTVKYGQGNTVPASWHKICDSDGVIDCLPDGFTAFHVRGYNSPTLGLEISNADARWDNKPAAWVKATLANAAEAVAPWVTRYNLPVSLNSRSQVDAAVRARRRFGFSYHAYLDPSRRTDPGIDKRGPFPWAVFAGLVNDMTDGGDLRKPMPTPAGADPVAALQKILKVTADKIWGPNTDARAQAMRAFARDKVSNVRVAQAILGVTVDGISGPKTRAALSRWVVSAQRIFGVPADGAWGPVTDAAYLKFRSANHH